MSAQGSLDHLRGPHRHLRLVHEQARQGVRRRRGRRLNEPVHRGQPGHPEAFFGQLKKYYGFYTGGFLVFLIALADRRADGHVAQVDRLLVPLRHHRPVRRHRHHEPHRRRGRVLRRGTARAGVLQRHGDRRRLDERGVLHRHGRHALPRRLRRPRVGDGLDRRLRAGGAVPRALPAQVRPVHHSRLPRRALRRQHRAQRRHLRRDPVLVHLRRGADLRRRPDHQPLHRPRVRHRRVRRPRRHPGLLVPGRHARGHLDAGGAVHHPDHRVPDAGGLAVVQAHRQPDPAARLRHGAAEGRPSARRCSPPIRRRSRCATSSRRAPTPRTRS